MSRNWLVVCAAACLLAAGTAVQAADGSIAVYVDDAGTQCEGIHGGGIMTGSIWMNLAGATASGITGTEFRVDNSDGASYFVNFDAVPGSVYIGNIMLGGGNIAFGSCQTGTRVKLGTLSILELVHTNDVSMTVRQKFEPSNEQFPCALAVLCDSPVFTKVCIGANNSDHWRAVLNPSDGVSGDCNPVATVPTSWSTVKALFN